MIEPIRRIRQALARRPRSLVVVGAALAGGFAAAACLSPTDANTATAQIEAEGGTSAVVVTSKNFGLSQSGRGELEERLITADTTVMDLSQPVERRFDISTTHRFFIRITPPDTTGGSDVDVPESVSLQVLIDGDSKFNQTTDIRERPLEFKFVSVGQR